MRIWLPWIAAVSLLCVAPVEAARRPRYGGTLRILMQTSVDNADPAVWPEASVAAAAKAALTSQVFETLVRLDEQGRIEPWLATAWTHDVPRKRWLFTPREGVRLHDGSLWQPEGGAIAISDAKPIDEILASLAHPRNAVTVRTPGGALLGTGPFRVLKWDAKTVGLAAHDRHWQGRPFLDSVEVSMGISPREQSLTLELNRADAIEVPANEVRALRQRGARLSVSLPLETIALVLARDKIALRERLSLAVDRQAIHQVILQRQGEPTGALLPQWLTGYAFLFSAPFQPMAAQPPAGLGLSYDNGDPLLRAIGERVALNATQAGITMRPASRATATVRLVRLRPALDGTPQPLALLAAELNVTPGDWAGFDGESALIEAAGVVPLFHLPVALRFHERVHGWAGTLWARTDTWRLENVWVEEKR